MQQSENHYQFNVSLGEVQQTNLKMQLKYSQTTLDDYEIVFKFKMKSGIDVKTADSEFRDRCKSCYTILTSFVKPIRDFLKPTYTLTYHADENYAYITFRFSNTNDEQEFLEICRFIKQVMERSQSKEEVDLLIKSDVSFKDLGLSLANAIYNMNLQIQGNARFQKDTLKLFESLVKFDKKDLPFILSKIDCSQILTYLQLLQNMNAEINFNKLNYDIGIAQPSFELPFKMAIYSKLQKYAEQYIDDEFQLVIRGPGIGMEVSVKYTGSIFELIDNILIIKQ